MTCTAVEAVTSNNLLLPYERDALLTIATATGQTPDAVLGRMLSLLGPHLLDAASLCAELDRTGAAFQAEMADYFATWDVLGIRQAEDRLAKLVADFVIRASRVIESRAGPALDVRPSAPSAG